METNLNDNQNYLALISKRICSYLKSTNKSAWIPDSVYYNGSYSLQESP